MSSSNPFSLVLSCGGLKFNGISLCSGTINTLINFDRHFDGLDLEKIMNFLDHTCGLFDSPIIDWNKLTNTLKMLREQYGLIDDKLWMGLHTWLPQHKKCGAVLSLYLNSDLKKIMSMPNEVLTVISPNK